MRVAYPLETIMQLQNFHVEEMTAAAAIGLIAQNIEAGTCSEWDADYLHSVGVDLDDDQYFKIANGLTTLDDAESVWDAAFYCGVI